MFKIESYITPIILSYVDKYIKNLKPEDSQVSLWGGDAVFNNLDLKLDVLEQELGTPFSFINGHIHELRIHVPWTRLGSEPVIITINTIECILKLSEYAASERGSSASSAGEHAAGVTGSCGGSGTVGGSGSSIKLRGEPKFAGKVPELLVAERSIAPPTNYVQSLINRVINNISIICNNVILKYVEDDIVLSLNAKSVEVFSVNSKWERAFVDLTLPELILRKIIRLVDLTVCLDRRDASGKISIYQDPLLYRCSLDCRLHQAFENIYGNRLLTTKLDILCDQLDFSVTDHQLTMFLRLIELGLALQAKELAAAAPKKTSDEEKAITDVENNDELTSSWGSWLWSYVPSGITGWSDGDADDKRSLSSPVVQFGFYVKKATYMFKVEDLLSGDGSGFINRKINFRPLCALIIESQFVDVITRGVDVFNLKMGASKITGVLGGHCPCGIMDSNNETKFFVAGVGNNEFHSSHSGLFIRDSLFDDESVENNGQHREYCFDWDQHFHIFSDNVICAKTPALALDYFYLLEIPDDISEKSSGISINDLENSSLKEKTFIRIFMTSPKLEINSSVVHRYQIIMAASKPYDYEPYAKSKEDIMTDSATLPTAEEAMTLEKFVPHKILKFILLSPVVKIAMANHPNSIEEVKSSHRLRKSKSLRDVPALIQLPTITITGSKLEFQQRAPLYPKRVVRIVSLLRSPSEYLMINSHYCFGIELVDGCAFVSCVCGESATEVRLPLIEPCHLTYKKKSLLLPSYWRNPTQPHVEITFEGKFMSIIATAPEILLLKVMWASWYDDVWQYKQLQESSIINDAFFKQSAALGLSFKFGVDSLTWKQSRNSTLKCYAGTAASFSMEMENIDNKTIKSWIPVFYGPHITTSAHNLNFFSSSASAAEPIDKLASQNPFIKFSFQIPVDHSNIITPLVLFLHIRNSVCCVDSRLTSWISYRPFVRDVSEAILPQPFAPESLDTEGHSKDSKIGSGVSVGDRVTGTDASKTKSWTTASVNKKLNQNNSLTGPLQFVSDWYPVLQKLSILVEFEGAHLILCKNFIPWSGVDLLKKQLIYNIQEMFLNQKFPQALVVNFPWITIANEGQKMAQTDHMDIPISSINGSDKFPWSLKVERYSSFTLDQHDLNYIIVPNSVASTFAINSKSGHLNYTQLNICFHCDFQPVSFHLSHSQASFAVVIKDHVIKFLSFLSLVRSPGSRVLVPSVNTWPFFYENSIGDQKSRKTSGESDREKSISDVLALSSRTSDNGVKVSLWLQTTLPKLTANIVGHHRDKEIRVCFEMEEITCSFDVQEVYSKIKLKITSVKATNYFKTDKSLEWRLGTYDGITFNSGQMGRRFYVSNMSFGADSVHELGFKSGELPDSFIIATFTCVQRKNVQKRWAKILRERSSVDDPANSQTMGLACDTCRSRFISEIDLKLMPMEIVFNPLVAKCIYGVIQPLLVLMPSSSTQYKTSAMPALSTVTLPLIYFSCTDVTVLVPHPTINERIDVQEDSSKKLKDDLVVLQLGSIDLTPNADNPLPRIIIKPDIFNVAQRAGILKIPGSEVEDRQYQIDIKGLSLSTGVWQLLVKASTMQTFELSQLKTMGENPAVEWNLKSSSVGDDIPTTTLCPLISSFDLRVVAAPAIVYEKGELGFHDNDVLIAGHSLEMNVTTSVTIYGGLHQLDLLLKTASLMKSEISNDDNLSGELARHKLNKFVREMDSGIESEATSCLGILLNLPAMSPSPMLDFVPSVLSPQIPPSPLPCNIITSSLPEPCKDTVPYEVLLTAGLITVMLYFPENYINVPKEMQFPRHIANRLRSTSSFTLDGTGSKIRKRFQSPERKGQTSSSSSDGQLIQRRSIFKNKSRENSLNNSDTAVGYDGSVESSEEDSFTIEETDSRIVPVFHLLISQPYTLVKCNKGSYKMELSCFDVNVKGVNALRPVQSDFHLPKLQHYNSTWLETVHGDADSKTGIPPSFYTITVVSQTSKPNVAIKVERPVKVIWDIWKYMKLNFLMDNLEVFKSNKCVSHVITSEHQASLNWQKWMRLFNDINFSTKQVVVVLEAIEPNFGEGRMILSITDCNAFSTVLCHNLKDDLSCATLSVSINGCLLKNQFIDSEPRPFIGPFSTSFETTVKWESWATSPLILTKLALDTVIVNVDQTHLNCMFMVIKNLAPVSVKNESEGSISDFNWLLEFDKVSNDCQIWQDDLRVGIFQYTQNSDDPSALPLLPGPNEIIFRKEQAGLGASMTWKYPEPRILIRTEIHPVPFRAAADALSPLEDEVEYHETEVSCALQYWDQLRCSFITYKTFCLSETEPCILDLPAANVESRRELVVSSTWRVLMNYSSNENESDDESSNSQNRCAVSPLALAACMRVDSCFRLSVIPNLQILFSLDLMKVVFRNDFSNVDSSSFFENISPFKLDGTMPSYQEFLIATLENVNLFHRHWYRECKVELDVVTRLEIVDYYFLTLQPVMDPVDLHGQLLVSLDRTKHKLYEFEFLFNAGKVFFYVSPQSLHTLTLACSSWADSEKGSKKYNLLSAYLICNNSLETIRFGQVDTDENIVLCSQQAHAYSWRSTKCKQVIHVCIEGMRWKWCEAFDIDTEGIQVIEVESNTRKATLIIRTKQLNPIQKQVIISGQLMITNRLCRPLECQIKRNTKQPSSTVDEMSAVILSNGYLPSFIIQYEDSWILQFRAVSEGKNKNSWTAPIALDNNKNLSPMQVIDSNGKEINFWCNVFKQSVANVTRQLIVLCPLYIARSFIPQQLSLEINTPNFNESTLMLDLEGKSVHQHLYCPGPSNLQHNLKFRIKPESAASSQSLSLTPSSIKSAAKCRLESLLDIDSICESYLNSEETMWPYDYFEDRKDFSCENKKRELSFAADSPITELEVTLKQRWAGCDTLLIDVKPWALMTNRSGIDCVLVFKRNSEEQTIILPANSVTALPKLTQSNIQVGIVCNQEFYFSKPLSLFGYDDGWFNLNQSKSFKEDYQHLDITMSTSEPKMCFLTLGRIENVEAEMNIFTIRSRYVLSNFSTTSVSLLLFARSSSASKSSLSYGTNNYQVVGPSVTEVELLVWKRVGEDNELFVPHVKFCHSDDLTKWSIPIRLGSEEEIIGHRMDYMYSVIVPPFTAYRVCCQEHRGSIILMINRDETPHLQLHNRCPVKLYVAQGTSQPVDDGTDSFVSEEYLSVPIDEMANVESMMSTFYTLPFVTQKFPQIYDPIIIPRLHLAEGSTHSDVSVLEWSSGILLTSDTDQFIAIPNCGDIKVHIERISATTHLFLDPVNRVEVSAKEIRSRIKRDSQSKKTGKFSRSPSVTSLNIKWKTEEMEDTSSIGPSSPIPSSSSPLPKSTAKLKESIKWSLYGIFHLSHVCIVVSGSTKEILRISIDHWQLVTRTLSDSLSHLKSSERNNRQQEFIMCLGDLQVDNQLHGDGGFDFSVILLRQNEIQHDINWNEIASSRRHSLFTITAIIQGQGSNMSKWLVKDMEINLQPVAIYSEDSLIYTLIDLMRNIQFSVPTRKSKTLQISQLHPHSTLIIRRLVVHPITLLLSLRLSTKVFISFDHTPLKFKAFERTLIWTTWYRFGHTLALHYMSGALINAGWVIGSLDLLANPGGFARAVGTGVSDLFRLPYRGLMNGPWAFISGIIQGTSSLISHIGSGTVMSITNLASSISRNMDHLAMDHVHLERNEELRRSPPQGLTAGLSQGLSGFGISLLGAMAGIVHPLIVHPAERPLTHAAAGILTGVGKGLVGVVVKPVGGVAEFVAQAGQGILHGAGWIRDYKARYEPVTVDLINSQNSFLKYVWKMLPNSRSSNDLILAVEATHVNSCGNYTAISLLLTSEGLFVVSLDTDSQQQAFGLTELDCQADHNDPTAISFFKRQTAEDESQYENKPNDRVAEFVDRASKYTAKSRRGLVQNNTILDESESSSSSCSSPPSYDTDPWKSKSPIVPVFSFYLPPRLRDTFINCYIISQRNVLGKGFN